MQTAMGDRIVGRVLEGRYRVLERVARGGMSTVYRALDERLDREVAVKVMSDALSTDPAFADRFAREARVAARLSHLNAVAVYDQGTDDGHVFLVMELVRGRTLRDLLRERGVMPAALAVSIMEPVLGALAAAHRAGLVHRDVKPENILLSDDGAVKVADFGLARAVESDASSTRTGLMMGTVAYCPPEQISRGAADARSDVYSAGVVLFELLTGSAPFVGDSAMAVAYQHVNSDVPAPSSRRPGIPGALDAVVLRATSREPSGRPLDAGALLAELHDVQVDLGLPVVGVPPRPRTAVDPDATQVISMAPLGNDLSPMGASVPVPVTDPIGANPLAALAAGTAAAATQVGPVADPDQQTVIGGFAGQPVSTGHRRPTAGPDRRRRTGRRRTLIVVLIILLLGLLTGYGAWYFAVGRYRSVPNLVGMSQSVATSRLVSSGFSVDPTVNQQFSESAIAGTIITTQPGARSHLLGGDRVTLVISKGPERYVVPQTAGTTFEQAQQALTAAPVQVVRSDAADDKVPAGQVIRTDPPAGTKVRRSQPITVFVSTGPPVVTVPDVTNKSRSDAGQILQKAGFTAAFTDDYSDTVPTGTVISESPQANSRVQKFSVINVVLSNGPSLVTIPDIQGGADPGEAKAALESLGLKVNIVKKDKGFFDFSGYVVDRVDPAPGTQVRRGSSVVLRLK